MDCRDATERLPWYLTGALPASEREAVRRHLEDCPACRRELEETRAAARVFGAHVPAAVLIDLAWERPLPAADAELARSHVAACRDCADELAAGRESRAQEPMAQDRADRPAVRRVPSWVGAGLAATLVLGFVSGQWWRDARGAAALQAARDAQRAEQQRRESLETEAQRLRGEAERAGELERRLRALEEPRADVPLLELLPREAVERGGAAGRLPRVETRGAFLVLSLVAEAPGRYDDYRLEARGPTGETLWIASGLARQPAGDFVVLVPTGRLPAGRVELRLEGLRSERWSRLGTYTFEAGRPAAQ